MQRGQCLSIHLLVSGLPRLQSQLCLIQIEAKDWDGYMDSLTDSIFFPTLLAGIKKKSLSAIMFQKTLNLYKTEKEKRISSKKGVQGFL